MHVNTRTALQLADQIRETAYAVHEYLGQGYLEKIYENALAGRLKKAGLAVEQQFPLPVFDEDGTLLGNYYADLCVERGFIIEVKACKALTEEHKAQLLNYLKCTGIPHGLLINFGSFPFQIRKYTF